MESDQAKPAGSMREVFLAFLKLGLTSFGGPVAHIGYFRREFVARRRWLDEPAFADLVGLCQFLPGPASSQTGFALGLMRAGYGGGLAAWLGFTLPSALALTVFAFLGGALSGPLGQGFLHGLKLVAVAVVAQAVWGMARSLCPDRPRAALAVAAALIALLAPTALAQIAAIAAGALVGLFLRRPATEAAPAPLAIPVSKTAGAVALGLFFVLLASLPLASQLWPAEHAIAEVAAFWRAGALVFGGGHVVLPLLQAAVVRPGWVDANIFLAGYGAAQAVPGPLFTFAAYLGAVMQPGPNGWQGAVICLLAIFLPGLMLLLGVLPFWHGLRQRSAAQAAMRGANAAVVGLLLAALYNPVWIGAVAGPGDFALVLLGVALLTNAEIPPLAIVLLLAAGGMLQAGLG
jgi:chromate transporter